MDIQTQMLQGGMSLDLLDNIADLVRDVAGDELLAAIGAHQRRDIVDPQSNAILSISQGDNRFLHRLQMTFGTR